ncbi:acetylglutamate kinase [Arcticibacterium luteifluviistationis]|uniref:Acetylglutamate kinase n=1 Tax=Arcticibacterium luteifluviistationis TaxID=1784714 RepID=A0A2Z4GA61_9BACT|nr:acetylglutamate kinase [Arcticibacterium luteifluviistationis]AWV97965.1 acetylglutamate kinase [Arcticibacterium luteifluviistationis]
MAVNIIKIGGNVINDEVKLKAFLASFAALSGDKILVHGGGKVATKIAKDLGVETEMVEGRRITNAEMRDVVTMVYGGLINKKIVASLQSLNCNAIGLTGADAGVIRAHKRPVKTIDYGYVGDIDSVNAVFISSLLSQEITPVFAPLSFDKDFGILNTNADTQASAIATALSGVHEVNLIYCFEKKGVLLDAEDDDSVIPVLKPKLYEEYKASGVIYDGMIPKLDNAFDAVHKGVKKVIICEANELLSAVERGETGTQILM